jgi:hypothetical protein
MPPRAAPLAYRCPPPARRPRERRAEGQGPKPEEARLARPAGHGETDGKRVSGVGRGAGYQRLPQVAVVGLHRGAQYCNTDDCVADPDGANRRPDRSEDTLVSLLGMSGRA